MLSTLLKFNKWQIILTHKTRVSTKEDQRAVVCSGESQSVPGKNPWDSAQSWNGAVWFFPEGRTVGLWPLLSRVKSFSLLAYELGRVDFFEKHCEGVDAVFVLGLLY